MCLVTCDMILDRCLAARKLEVLVTISANNWPILNHFGTLLAASVSYECFAPRAAATFCVPAVLPLAPPTSVDTHLLCWPDADGRLESENYVHRMIVCCKYNDIELSSHVYQGVLIIIPYNIGVVCEKFVNSVITVRPVSCFWLKSKFIWLDVLYKAV